MNINNPASTDLEMFSSLRNYYRDNFRNGKSDESFITWCENMCNKYNEANGLPVNPDWNTD